VLSEGAGTENAQQMAADRREEGLAEMKANRYREFTAGGRRCRLGFRGFAASPSRTDEPRKLPTHPHAGSAARRTASTALLVQVDLEVTAQAARVTGDLPGGGSQDEPPCGGRTFPRCRGKDREDIDQ
jgi:hypothetical protein